MTNKKRYLIVMLISVVFNTVFYLVAHFFHLPVWLDMQGTAFAAMILEPTAGILVGLVNNFIEAIFFYDVTTIMYFLVSASVALVVGLMIKKDGKISIKRIIPVMLLVIVVTTILSTLLDYWISGGVPDSKWELYFYNMAMGKGVPHILSTAFGAFVLKIGDVVISTVLITLLYWILPKSLRYAPKKIND